MKFKTSIAAAQVRHVVAQRIDSEIAASGAADKQLYTALNSTKIYPDEILVKGIEKVAEIAKVEPTEILDWILITDKKAARYIPQKGVDKCIRMALFFGGARIDNALDPIKAAKRKGVIDSFTSALFTNIAKFAALPRNEKGQICGPRPTVEMDNEEGFELYAGIVIAKPDFEAYYNFNRYVDDRDMFRPDLSEKAWADYGLTYNPGTAKTQVSQLRSTLNALGLADCTKHQKPSAKTGTPKLTISARLAKAICATIAENPIPAEWYQN